MKRNIVQILSHRSNWLISYFGRVWRYFVNRPKLARDCIPFISHFIFGTSVKSSQTIFQKFFHRLQCPLDGIAHGHFADTFHPGNVRLGHAKNEVSVNSLFLFVWQTGDCCKELLHGNFALVELVRRHRHESEKSKPPKGGIGMLIGLLYDGFFSFAVVEQLFNY